MDRRDMERVAINNQGPEALKPIGEEMGAISHAKQKAHDLGLVDRPDGRFLTSSQIYNMVRRNSTFFVGQTETGDKKVFGVVPEPRSRKAKTLPTDVLLSHKYATQMEYLKAVSKAEKAGQINKAEAYSVSLEVLGGQRYIEGYLSVDDKSDLQFFKGINPQKAVNILSTRREIEKSYIKKVSSPKIQEPKTTGNDSDKNRLVIPGLGALGVSAALPQLAVAAKAERRGYKLVQKVLIGSSITSVVLGACAPVTQSPEQTTAGEEQVGPEAADKEIKESFIAAHPEYASREMITMRIRAGDEEDPLNFDTVLMESTEAEKNEAPVILYNIRFDGTAYTADGNFPAVGDKIVWTQRILDDGSTEWVKLIGLAHNVAGGTKTTAWYLVEGENTNDVSLIDLNTHVFAYNSGDAGTLAFWPPIENPEEIGWGGKNPIFLNLKSLPPAAAKVFADIVAAITPTPNVVPSETVQAPEAFDLNIVIKPEDESKMSFCEPKKNADGTWGWVSEGLKAAVEPLLGPNKDQVIAPDYLYRDVNDNGVQITWGDAGEHSDLLTICKTSLEEPFGIDEEAFIFVYGYDSKSGQQEPKYVLVTQEKFDEMKSLGQFDKRYTFGTRITYRNLLTPVSGIPLEKYMPLLKTLYITQLGNDGDQKILDLARQVADQDSFEPLDDVVTFGSLLLY